MNDRDLTHDWARLLARYAYLSDRVPPGQVRAVLEMARALEPTRELFGLLDAAIKLADKMCHRGVPTDVEESRGLHRAVVALVPGGAVMRDRELVWRPMALREEG